MTSVTFGRTLPLTPDELLTTTRSVRKRLDLTRPVEREVIQDCLRIAQQAPSAGNLQPWHFIVVTDPDKRRALAEVYRAVAAEGNLRGYLDANQQSDDALYAATQKRVAGSALHLLEHLHEVPVFLIPCVSPRPAGGVAAGSSVIQAAWSFMLAARARGLGTCWTTLHLFREAEAAAILAVPYDLVAQVALIAVAYTKGTDFKPAHRRPLDDIVHWDGW